MKDSLLAKIRAVTAADLTRVARAWFDPDKKSVGVLLPKS
jgi:predicted Zn-dependent peptidase